MELENLIQFIEKHDNAENFINFHVPELCKNEDCILGVDEAGRGPVLGLPRFFFIFIPSEIIIFTGPMVYGIAFCPNSKQALLKDLGFADSKQLSEKEREEIFVAMKANEDARNSIGWATEAISPNVISSSMLRRVKRSLNEVSMDSAIGLINLAIEKGAQITEVYVDTVGPPEKYQAKLKALFPDFKIVVAKKADSTYPIVSAASICAKVTRDHCLKVWKFREGIEVSEVGFGSGYPNDPATKAFLTNIEPLFGFPRIVRFSWSTAGTALEKRAFDVVFEEEEPEPKKRAVKSKKVTEFFKSDENAVKKERNKFFKEKSLAIVTEF